MNDRTTALLTRRQRLHEVLLGCLQAAARPTWPGSDGLTIDDALQTYPQALVAGAVPGPDELLRLHPDLAEEIRTFFAAAAVYNAPDTTAKPGGRGSLL